jgi:periplasmic divalent cation tolerance protein
LPGVGSTGNLPVPPGDPRGGTGITQPDLVSYEARRADPALQIFTAMKRKTSFAVVLVTAPDMAVARKLARAALRARLIACANLVPKIESHYVWRGKFERAAEVLLVLKTTAARLPALEKLVLAQHPYDTPEFVVLPLVRGNNCYLDWLQKAVSGGSKDP